MMPTLPDLSKLDECDFWSLKCINSGGRHTRGKFRAYQCDVVHNHKRYCSTAKTLASAVSLTMQKIGIGQTKGKLPNLRLVGGSN